MTSDGNLGNFPSYKLSERKSTFMKKYSKLKKKIPGPGLSEWPYTSLGFFNVPVQ